MKLFVEQPRLLGLYNIWLDLSWRLQKQLEEQVVKMGCHDSVTHKSL